MLQPDLGTAIVLATTGFLIYYVSGAPIIQLVGLASTGVLGIIFLILSSPYHRARLTTFLDPPKITRCLLSHQPSLDCLGSGGLTGVGLGEVDKNTSIYLKLPPTLSLPSSPRS